MNSPALPGAVAPASLLSTSWANLAINIGLFLVGGLLASVALFFIRKAVHRWKWIGFPHTLVAVDGTVVVAATALGTSLELWKKQSLTSLDAYSAAGYAGLGFISTCGIGTKWLISWAKEITTARFTALQEKVKDAQAGRDIALDAEALIREVMNAKLTRLAERRRTGSGSLEDALAPEKQIHVLLQVLHRHFSKRLQPGRRLRIGIYMPDEEGHTLEPAFSWNGDRNNCFSNGHREFMRIGNPGGSRSVVVQCWLSDEPFVFVADTEKADHARFRYFYQGQENLLRSMVAYRHNQQLSPQDAFVITLDSDQVNFFGPDVESECRLLMPAFSRRIELELLALPDTQTD